MNPIKKVDNKLQSFAFFSSRMAIPALKSLREEVWELGEQSKIWVSERAIPNLSSETDQYYDEAEIHCLQMIRNSKEFICVLDGSYGATGWSRDWSQNEVSILELELFMAALERKPMHVFLLKPFERIDPRLNSLLQIIENVCPETLERTPKSSEEIKAQISSLLANDPRSIHSKSRKNLNVIIGLLAQFLARIRALRIKKTTNKFDDVYFLNAEFASLADVPPDKDCISQLLNNVNSAPKSQDKLAKLWTAIRHLSGAYYEDPKYIDDYLPLWDAVLSNWSSTSAWYGLHGHIYLGHLAALNTLLRIREIAQTKTDVFKQIESVYETYGAVASEYYSIAKMVPSQRDRKALLKRALNHINTALSHQVAPAGLLAIRGSILLALGKGQNAVSDYERELQLRLDAGETAGQIGEAEVELGMGYFRLGKIFRAQELLESGLANLRNSGRYAFIVRAMRKISLFYALTLRRQRALQMLEESYKIAQDHELQGQIRQIRSLPFAVKLILGKKNIESVFSSK